MPTSLLFSWLTLLFSNCTVATPPRSSSASKKSLSPNCTLSCNWFIDDFNKILPEKSPILEDPSIRASFSLLSEELKAGKQRHRAERKVQLYSQLQRKWLGASKWQLKQNLHVNRFLAVFFYMVMIWIYYLSADSMFSHSKAPTEDASTKSLQSRQQKLPELLSLDCSSLWWLLRAVFQISTSVLCGWKDWTIL